MTLQLKSNLILTSVSLALGATVMNVEARVVRITIDSTAPVSGGAAFGSVGAYELLRGTAYGELDPADRRNALITDIGLAPKNAAGKVEYATQFAIHKPVDMSKSSGIMVYNVPNRGGIAIPYTSGDSSFLWRRGDVVLNSAWQGDQPITSPTSNSLGINVPIAKMPDGSPVVGKIVSRFIAVSAGTGGVWQTTQSLPGDGSPTYSTDTSTTTLVSATHESPAGVKSDVVSIAPADYAFADCRDDAVPRHAGPDPAVPEERLQPGPAVRDGFAGQGPVCAGSRQRRDARCDLVLPLRAEKTTSRPPTRWPAAPST